MDDGDPSGSIDVGNTQWFGFVGIDCGYDDPLDDPVQTDYVDEVSDLSNAAHVCVGGPSDDLRSRLARLRATGSRAIVDLTPVLFETVAGESRADPAHRLALRVDAGSRLAQLFAANRPVLDGDHVAALYLVDEPTWNGVPAAELARAADLVAAASDLPGMVVEAGDALDGLVVPRAVDLVGFDRYDTVDPSTDPVWRGDLDRLLALRSRPEQRVVLVMDTQWRSYYGDAGVQPGAMAEVALRAVEVAATTPEVVGILGYLWPGGLDLPDQLGARELPHAVRATYRRIARAVDLAAMATTRSTRWGPRDQRRLDE